MPRKNEPTQILTLLGCGTSTGVPLIGCKCSVCKSSHPKNKRLRAAAWWQVGQKSLLVDTSTDLRQQALREKISRVDAVLFTHPHADHIHGIDELRSYNFLQKQVIPAYGNAWTCRELQQKFEYIFNPGPVEGGGIPQLRLNCIDAASGSIRVAGLKIIPVSLAHGSQECIGYRIGSVAYVTDCSYIGAASLDRLRNLSVLVLDCLRIAQHGTHFNFDQTMEVIRELRPKRTFLTHMGHDFDYEKLRRKLPKGVSPGYDGLKIRA